MAQYYVCTRSNWQGDPWKVIAGPFPNKREALDRASQAEYAYISPTGGLDLKSQVHAAVFSKTRLIRELGYSEDRLWQGLYDERLAKIDATGA